VKSTIRSAMDAVPDTLSGNYTRLTDIGVTMQRDGSLSVDSSALQSAMTADFSAVASLVAAYGSTLEDQAEALLGSGGAVTARSEGLSALSKDMDKRKEAIELRLSKIEARYRAQFTALDTAIASMNKTSSYLQQQLASLSKSQ
jgi:flagellar hook-associated protein 2